MGVLLGCKDCGAEFLAKSSEIDRGRAFCSYGCSVSWRRKNPVPKKLYDKVCRQCGKMFSVDRWHINRVFCSPSCRGQSQVALRRVYPLDRKLGNPQTKYSNLASRAKKRGLPHLTLDEFHRWYLSVERKCVYCEITEDTWINLFNGTHNKYGLEIDCVDPKEGYVPQNMVLACHRCNLTKSNIFSGEEMVEIAQKYITPKWRKLQESKND